MTDKPDPAAVRCAEILYDGGEVNTISDNARIITRECAIKLGRALAEAVLKLPGQFVAVEQQLARAYLSKLDGKEPR